MRNFPTKNFAKKMYRSVGHIEKKYGTNWSTKTLDREDLLWLVANYRISDKMSGDATNSIEFYECNLFQALDVEIRRWTLKCNSLKAAIKAAENHNEMQIISTIKESANKNYKETIMNFTKSLRRTKYFL